MLGALSISGGIMLFLSFYELIPESISEIEVSGRSSEVANKWTLYNIILCRLFLFCGLILGILLDSLMSSCKLINEPKLTKEMLEDIETKNEEEKKKKQEEMDRELESGRISIEMSELKTKEEKKEMIENMKRSPSSIQSITHMDEEKLSTRSKKKLIIVSIVTGIAMAIHNFPEGIATYTACCIILIYYSE